MQRLEHVDATTPRRATTVSSVHVLRRWNQFKSIYSFAQKSLEDTFTSSFKRKQFLQFWPQQHEDDDDRCDAPIRLKKGLASMTCVSPLHSLSLSLSLILSHSHTLLSQTVLASLSFSLIDTFYYLPCCTHTNINSLSLLSIWINSLSLIHSYYLFFTYCTCISLECPQCDQILKSKVAKF